MQTGSGQATGAGYRRIGSRKQLFLDHTMIESLDNCRWRFHPPVRYAGNPLIQADKPWENATVSDVDLAGGTVFFDAEAQIFKMWYRATETMSAGPGDVIGIPVKGGYRACYAVSRDGVHWEKPNLGLVEYHGSRENNIIPGIGELEYIRRPNLIKDYDEPDPQKRYKMIYADEVDGHWLLCKAYSADGIHWSMGTSPAVAFQPPLYPLGIIFGWDPRRGKFVHIHRKEPPTLFRADVEGRLVRGEMRAVLSTSADFEDWGDTIEIMGRDERLDPPHWEVGHLAFISAILYSEDLYIGLMDTATTYYPEEVPAALWDVYRWEHAEHRVELVMSRDGVHWTRVAPHWEFFRPGLIDTWDSALVAPCRPIILNDQILIYYSGRSLLCAAGHLGHPLRTRARQMGYAIGLATLRLDGFVAVEGYDPGGALTTPPLTFTGDRLLINAHAPEKRYDADHPRISYPTFPISARDVAPDAPPPISTGEPYGRLEVEILGLDGQPLPGYGRGECDPFTGDAIRHTVTWRHTSDVTALAGQPIRLRFHLHNAALYAFQFGDAHTAATPINHPEPGSRGHPTTSA